MSAAGITDAQVSDDAGIQSTKINFSVGKTFYVYNNALSSSTSESAGNIPFYGPLPQTTTRGQAGSDTNPGTRNRPLRTLAGALAKCMYGRGDTIIMLPGHIEYLENGLSTDGSVTISVADVTIKGIGVGFRRPIIYMGRGDATVAGTGTASNATTLTVNAPGVTIDNISFSNGGVATALVSYITGGTSGLGLKVMNCRFDQQGTTGNTQASITTVNNSSNWVIENCEFLMNATGGAPAAIMFGATTPTNTVIRNCRIYGFYTAAANACGGIYGTGALTQCLITRCSITNRSTTAGDIAVKLTSTTSSGCVEWTTVNSIASGASSNVGIVVGGAGTLWFVNQVYGADGTAAKQGVVNPVLDT